MRKLFYFKKNWWKNKSIETIKIKIQPKWERKWYMLHCSQRSNRIFDPDNSVTETIAHTLYFFIFIFFSRYFIFWYFCSGKMAIRICYFFLVLMTCPTVEWILKYKELCGVVGVPKCIFDCIGEREKRFFLTSISMKCHNLFTVSHFLWTFITISPTHHQTNVCVSVWARKIRSRKSSQSLYNKIYSICVHLFIWSLASIHL